MKRTKLEEYLAIIETLIVHGPIGTAELAQLSSLDDAKLGENLSFLFEQNTIEKRRLGNSVTYLVSPLGIRIFKYFSSQSSEKNGMQTGI
ncbi:MAG: hypothetical protein NWE98_08545 [Candidatus Bathyarchaeota archaeon]|nr:hypothetical protein [Candidatus Bathyarchaeota archaeon]